MAQTDHTTRNIVLGILLGPFAGGYFGYRYAQQKQELYQLNPTAERGWDGTFTNVLIGVLACGIAAPLFGYNVAKLDMKLDDIKQQAVFNELRARGQSPASYDLAQAQNVNPGKWQDFVAANAQQVEVNR